VDELRLVLGINDKLFRRIEPALTVYSGRPNLDPQIAPREALIALDHMDASRADTMIAARASRLPSVFRPRPSSRQSTLTPMPQG
jgi:general secretion pathway protein K